MNQSGDPTCWRARRDSNPQPFISVASDFILIRRSRNIVQDRPLLSVCWADIPGLSVGDRRCPAVWQRSLCSRYLFPTVRFSGRTYPQLARIVRVLCAVAGRCCSRLAAAVAVNSAQAILQQAGPHFAGDGLRPVRAGSRLALGFWPECPQSSRAQVWVPEILSAKRSERILGCP